MSEQQNVPTINEDEINLLAYAQVIWKRKILIGIIFFCAVFGSAIISLFMQKMYSSTVTFLSPDQWFSGSEYLSGVGGFPGAGAVGVGGLLSAKKGGPRQDLFMSLMKSSVLREGIVEQFKLNDYYQCKDIEKTKRRLAAAMKITISPEGVISVTVIDKSPQMAADIANSYIPHLERLALKLGAGAISRQRQFIAEQLAKTEMNLRESEDALKKFQEKYRAVSIGQQSANAISSAAQIKGEIIAAEVQLDGLKGFAKESHPEVVKLNRLIKELKQQLADAQYSSGLELPSVEGDSGHSQKEIYLPVVKVPRLTLELKRLTRSVTVQETVYALLNQELERAKIAEVRDTLVVQVLDSAVPPTERYKPARSKIVLMSGMISVVMGILIAFALEYILKQIDIYRLKHANNK
ncbi:MAG: GNVR domain-containing protein [Planctomycetota bacterium]